MRAALFGLLLIGLLAGVQAQSFCDTFLPPLTAAQSYNDVAATQYERLKSFLLTVAGGGLPYTLACRPPPEARRLLAECDDITGLFDRNLTKPFFNGANPTWRSAAEASAPNPLSAGASLPNYVTDGTAATLLVERLAQFFGQSVALNCTLDGSVPAYAGIANQFDVHKGMPITQAVFTEFVATIADTAVAYGVPAADPLLIKAAAVLNSFKRHTASPDTNAATICNQEDCECSTGLAATCKVAPADSSSSSSTGGGQGGAASTVSVSIVAMAFAAMMALIRQ